MELDGSQRYYYSILFIFIEANLYRVTLIDCSADISTQITKLSYFFYIMSHCLSVLGGASSCRYFDFFNSLSNAFSNPFPQEDLTMA